MRNRQRILWWVGAVLATLAVVCALLWSTVAAVALALVAMAVEAVRYENGKA